MKRILVLCSLVISISVFGQISQKGNLVIVGGGLDANNNSIYNQLIEFAGGAENASFAIIPSASGVSMQSFVYFKSTLRSYGIKSENIHLINIAMIDDDSTTNVNEATWSKNANDENLAEVVKKCSAVWFTGGDQMRTLETMKNADGSNSLVLDAVWDVYNRGGVIGGSSAGAAIMSEIMIGDGNSMSALRKGVKIYHKGEEFKSEDGVLVTEGLGFFPTGIVDQHFQQRNRLGRLIVTLINNKDKYNLGFGIDENTALIYMGNQNIIRVAGGSGVTFVDTQFAEISFNQNKPTIKNLRISYLEDGDTYDININKIIPSPEKKSTIGAEQYNHNVYQEGVFSGQSPTFRELITEDLIDNKATDEVRSISFYSQDQGFMAKFFQQAESEGFYFDNPNGKDGYTVGNIRMDIVPAVQVLKTID